MRKGSVMCISEFVRAIVCYILSIKNSGFSRAISIHFGHNLSLVSGGVLESPQLLETLFPLP